MSSDTNNKSNSLINIQDIFGIKALSDTVSVITEAAVKNVSGFLSVVCKPCCEEFGLMLQDNIRTWRLNNVIKILEKSKGKLAFDGNQFVLRANPRVGLSIMDESSIVDDEELQDFWAGLFASSCTEDGKDDSNMSLVDLLKRMSSVEVKILKYACEHCQKKIYPNSLILAEHISVPLMTLVDITGVDNIYRLDYEMDHMRSLMLLNHGGLFNTGGGFIADDENLSANITPSALGLSLFYKTHTHNSTPKEFWKDSLVFAEATKMKSDESDNNDSIDGNEAY